MPENVYMSKKTKQIMAGRLSHLMARSADLDTNAKVAARSGVSYGTVRRIRLAEDTDVQIGHVEAIANAFRMSLVEFISDFDEQREPTPEERAVINDLRALEPEAAKEFCSQIARMAMLQRAKNHSIENVSGGQQMAG